MQLPFDDEHVPTLFRKIKCKFILVLFSFMFNKLIIVHVLGTYLPTNNSQSHLHKLHMLLGLSEVSVKPPLVPLLSTCHKTSVLCFLLIPQWLSVYLTVYQIISFCWHFSSIAWTLKMLPLSWNLLFIFIIIMISILPLVLADISCYCHLVKFFWLFVLVQLEYSTSLSTCTRKLYRYCVICYK